MTKPPSAVIHAWLSFCRKQRPELTEAEFQRLVPHLIKLRRQMLASNRKGYAMPTSDLSSPPKGSQ